MTFPFTCDIGVDPEQLDLLLAGPDLAVLQPDLPAQDVLVGDREPEVGLDQSEVSTGSRDLVSANHSSPGPPSGPSAWGRSGRSCSSRSRLGSGPSPSPRDSWPWIH